MLCSSLPSFRFAAPVIANLFYDLSVNKNAISNLITKLYCRHLFLPTSKMALILGKNCVSNSQNKLSKTITKFAVFHFAAPVIANVLYDISVNRNAISNLIAGLYCRHLCLPTSKMALLLVKNCVQNSENKLSKTITKFAVFHFAASIITNIFHDKSVNKNAISNLIAGLYCRHLLLIYILK